MENRHEFGSVAVDYYLNMQKSIRIETGWIIALETSHEKKIFTAFKLTILFSQKV